ncbi:hypothetical protein [Solimonas marina]|uniref:Bacterial virulence factor lipase N-terminal domain-containing protein n=1 Tax=Solimonas marina TaxID=2714601 RepID=A0A970B7M8_9GAMM|nr:hypothetical protein [Solimonas marina]NKF24068.1 hypothetical protein [Solimonas marina]
MRTRTIVSLLLAAGLVACSSAHDDDTGFAGTPANAYSLFDPVAASAIIPFPFDGLFTGTTDGTLNIPNGANDDEVPFVTAANKLDGFSTTSSLFTDFIGYVDVADALNVNTTTHLPGVLVINAATLQPLTPGVDYTLQSSTAIDPDTGLPLNELRTRMLIEPLKPLQPSTQYIVVVTTQVTSTDGVPVEAADLFRVVRSTTAVSQQTEPVLSELNDTQKATLEGIRQQFAPMFDGLAAAGITRDNIVIAWPFTTQNTQVTLKTMGAQVAAHDVTVVATGLNTAQVLSGAPATGDVYVGSMTVPYYLDAPSDADPTAPLTTYWKADTSQPASSSTVLPALSSSTSYVTCGQLAPSESTTTCYPMPVEKSEQRIPVILTIPNANSGKTMPSGGWPVVIFQHGITGNRSQSLAIAPTLAAAGYATIAIDLPLHGLPPGNALRAATDAFPTSLRPTERTFDLDVMNNDTGAAGADGVVDSSGASFINLSSLLTSRDNIRQGVSDIMTLAKSVGGTVVLNSSLTPAGITLDGSQIRYVGHSLGAITMSTMLGANDDTAAAALAMPGGGIAKLLDGSAAFGPRIAAGLAASSGGEITEGNDNYETFLRFAQTAVDAADPLNFATDAAANHPILMIEVRGDAVVPNCTIANDVDCPATDTIPISGYLGGSDPLARALGLGFIPGPAQTDVLTVPASAQTLVGAAARNNVVRFATGSHASILDPSDASGGYAVTCEMQAEVASFVATNGTALQIGACPSAQ